MANLCADDCGFYGNIRVVEKPGLFCSSCSRKYTIKKNSKVEVAPTSGTSSNNGGDKLSSGTPALLPVELAKFVSEINNKIQRILSSNTSPVSPLITRADTANPSSAATATVNSTSTATTAVNKSVATVGASDVHKQIIGTSKVTDDVASATSAATSTESKSLPSKKAPATNNARYPPHKLKRALIMREGSFNEVRKELQSRGFKIVMLRTSPGDVSWKSLLIRELRELHICKHDVVIANPMWVDVALKELRIPVPEPPDYPPCVSHMLRRKVWKSTLAQVRAALLSGQHKTLFIKPASGAKSFNGEVLHGPVDDVLECFLGPYYPHILPSQEVHCGEVVDMNSEYAVYLVDGFVRSICHYQCKRSTCRCCDAELAQKGNG